MEDEKILQEIELWRSTMGAMCRLPSTPLDKSRQTRKKTFFLLQKRNENSKTTTTTKLLFVERNFAFEFSGDLLRDFGWFFFFIVERVENYKRGNNLVAVFWSKSVHLLDFIYAVILLAKSSHNFARKLESFVNNSTNVKASFFWDEKTLKLTIESLKFDLESVKICQNNNIYWNFRFRNILLLPFVWKFFTRFTFSAFFFVDFDHKISNNNNKVKFLFGNICCVR